jgi:hypothetical protein
LSVARVTLTSLVLGCSLCSPAAAQVREGLEIPIRSAAPSAFRNLPSAAVATLSRRGCRIPQPYSARGLANVIRGAFTGAKRSEWAVLCSVRDTSQILVLTASTGRLVDSLARSSDLIWMQAVGGKRCGYSRHLSTLSGVRIRDWVRDDDGRPIPQRVDHDAIRDSFDGKAATAYYCTEGRWYRRVAAD